MFLFILNLIVALILGVQVMNAMNSMQRGTNAVTKFVRDVSANSKFSRVTIFAVIATVITLLLAMIPKSKPVWACIPTIAVLILSFVAKSKSTKSKDRVEASRTVTKGALEAGAAVGETAGEAAGAIAGAYTGNPKLAAAGRQAGKAIGGSVGNISKKAADSMTDVKGIGVTKEDMAGVNQLATGIAGGAEKAATKKLQVADPQAFMSAAKRVGIAQGDEDVNEVAGKVYAMIPEAAKTSMSDISEEEQAMRFLEGKV